MKGETGLVNSQPYAHWTVKTQLRALFWTRNQNMTSSNAPIKKFLSDSAQNEKTGTSNTTLFEYEGIFLKNFRQRSSFSRKIFRRTRQNDPIFQHNSKKKQLSEEHFGQPPIGLILESQIASCYSENKLKTVLNLVARFDL